jgi:hypothetical protein
MVCLTPQVTQLTGFSDPVYAEAYVNVNQYDIVLDVLIVNQTTDTLQNVALELATLGESLGCCCFYISLCCYIFPCYRVWDIIVHNNRRLALRGHVTQFPLNKVRP